MKPTTGHDEASRASFHYPPPESQPPHRLRDPQQEVFLSRNAAGSPTSGPALVQLCPLRGTSAEPHRSLRPVARSRLPGSCTFDQPLLGPPQLLHCVAQRSAATHVKAPTLCPAPGRQRWEQRFTGLPGRAINCTTTPTVRYLPVSRVPLWFRGWLWTRPDVYLAVSVTPSHHDDASPRFRYPASGCRPRRVGILGDQP